MRVLVADDDAAVARAVALALEVAGYHVDVAADGSEALAMLTEGGCHPDLLVLDWMMPRLDGLALCRLLRAAGDRTPILVLSAREQVTDRVAGLEAGADDYLAKPFDIAELVARLRALVRRTHLDGPELLRFADLSLDAEHHTGTRGHRRMEFTRTEAMLLELFLRNPGLTLSQDLIRDRVWGTDVGPTSNSVAVYLGYLRRKLEEDGEPRLLHTVRGLGYRLAEGS